MEIAMAHSKIVTVNAVLLLDLGFETTLFTLTEASGRKIPFKLTIIIYAVNNQIVCMCCL